VGALRQDLLKMVIGQAFRFAAVGIVSGRFLAFLVARVMNGLLIQITQFDPLATGLTVCILIAGITAAAAIPARRAAMLNPTDALHSE
jgi:putative ABC transport system permease protein